MSGKVCTSAVCPQVGREQPLENFPRKPSRADGRGSRCKTCHAAEQKARHAARSADAEYDVGIANDPNSRKLSAQAAREKRQEFNRQMGENAEALKHAARTAPSRDGDVLTAMPSESGTYIGALAEQEERFGARRLARTVSLAQASEAMHLAIYKDIARQFFGDKIAARGFARKPSNRKMKRSACLLLSDLHLGSNLSSLDEPLPFGAVQEARRLEYLLRQLIDYKPQYRDNTEFVLGLNGDVIEGLLMHQIAAGAPLAEQKAIFWSLFRPFMAELSAAFPSGRVFMQPGNHGRDKVRHPGRATWRKWDGHEWEMYFALREMCSGLRNVTFDLPFRSISKIDLHGATVAMSHGDTEIKTHHPDRAELNARQLDKINANRVHGCSFAGFLFGHYHTARHQIEPTYHVLWNGPLVPPNGHARSEGWFGACGQWLFEAVEGHPIGDARFVQVGAAQDNDPRLGQIIKPFRFPVE